MITNIQNKKPLRVFFLKKILTPLHKLEYLYVFIALGFGIVFIFLIPPGWNSDEPQHYWRVQQIVHGDVLSKNFEWSNSTWTGGPISVNSTNFILSYGGYTAINDYSYRLKFPMFANNGMNTEKDNNEKVNVSFSGSARYSPVVYLPQIIGVWIADNIGASLLFGFILAKMLGLIVQVSCFAYAIRLLPKGKWILFAVGLLPSTIVQSVAFGGDVMTTSVIVLFISLVLYASYRPEKINKKIITSIIALIFFLGLVKIAYLPLASLIILIPITQKRFRNIKSISALGILSVIAALPGVIWYQMTSFAKDHYSNGVDFELQKTYVIDYPLKFAKTLLRTYLTDDQPKLLKTLFGNFVWDSAPLPLIFMFAGVVILTISCFLSSPRELQIHLTKTVKTILLSMFIGLTVLISYALYVYYTPLKSTSILGIQGRYFLPILLLPLLVFHRKIERKLQIGPKVTLISLIIIMLLSAATVIFYRIYT